MGDELLMINGMLTCDLDMTYIETLLEESDLVTLTLRSCRCIERWEGMLRVEFWWFLWLWGFGWWLYISGYEVVLGGYT